MDPSTTLDAVTVQDRTGETNGPPRPAVPPLFAGDRLTRHEFHRRYEAMPNLKKAELVEGVVYMPSPLRLRYHGAQHIRMSTWLGVYLSATPGTEAGDDSSLFLDLDNEVQPDLMLFIEAPADGRSRISPDGYVEGAYVSLPADEAGVVDSRVFPGLRLDLPAMLAGDLARVLAVQQAALGGEAHAAFVARLGAV